MDFFPYPWTAFAVEETGSEEHSGMAAQKPLSFLPCHGQGDGEGPRLWLCSHCKFTTLWHCYSSFIFCHVRKYYLRQEKMLYFKYSSDKQQNFPGKLQCFKEDSCAAKGHNMRGLMIQKGSPPSKDRYALSVLIIESKFCTTSSVCTL